MKGFRTLEKGMVAGAVPDSKLRAGARFLRTGTNADKDVVAMIEVREGGYVPASVRLRERIGPTVFTALIPAGHMERTLKDPRVVVVEPSRILHPETDD